MISKIRLVAAAVGVAAVVMPMSASAAPARDPGLLQQKQPNVSYVYGQDFTVPSPVPEGNVVGRVQAVDATSDTSGCEASDFAAFTAGNIALIRRGTCNFSVKVANAEQAGASGVLIFNDDSMPALITPLLGTDVTIPVLFVTRSLGEAFVTQTHDGLRVHILVRHVPKGSPNQATS